MKTLKDLYAERDALDKQIEEAKKLRLVQEVEASRRYRKSITPEIGKWLLDHIEHTYSSCRKDEDIGGNGFTSLVSKGYGCPKCALAEYLDEEWLADDYSMEIEVHFYKIGED